MSNGINRLSRNQYGALREIKNRNITAAYLRNCLDITIWSLGKRGYISKKGRGDEAIVTLTQEGEEAYMAYSRANLPLRKHEAEITNRLRAVLGMAQVINLKKGAA